MPSKGPGPLLSSITHRACSMCGFEKALDQFRAKGRASKYPNRLSGIDAACIPCARKRAAERRARLGDSYRVKQYGLSLEQFNALFARQGGCCRLCLRHQLEVPKQKLQIDHDHVTGKVRGLLCAECNMGIGLLRESPEILARAIEYLGAASQDGNEREQMPAPVVEIHSRGVG